MLFNLPFANHTTLSCFFFFFLKIDLHFLIPVVVAQISSPTAELEIPIRIPSKDAKAEIKTHLVISKAKISAQYDLESYKPFCANYSSIDFSLFLLMK